MRPSLLWGVAPYVLRGYWGVFLTLSINSGIRHPLTAGRPHVQPAGPMDAPYDDRARHGRLHRLQLYTRGRQDRPFDGYVKLPSNQQRPGLVCGEAQPRNSRRVSSVAPPYFAGTSSTRNRSRNMVK